jgi:hypothetical protein
MTRTEYCAKKEEAVRAFAYEGEILSLDPYGNGHINDTFLLKTKLPDGAERKYILQRMNHEIFLYPEQVMHNIVGVTSFLKEKIQKQGGDPLREAMTPLVAKSGEYFYRDSIGSFWRSYLFIEDTVCLDQVTRPEEFYESAVAFGHFQSLLADYPAQELFETIPHFHDTPDRYSKFVTAVLRDSCGRAASVEQEILFLREREPFTHLITDLMKEGKIPLRVTHNDTKLNNIMLDAKSGKAVCVIDLDTVMPGSSLYDFGDSIRFGASTAAEDEPDLEKVHFDLHLFELYTKGYLEGCGGSLTQTELEYLPAGAKMMTLECGMRFLTDYLEGDVYFNIHREGQNLDRCRTQFRLVQEMESNWEEMKKIVEKYHK